MPLTKAHAKPRRHGSSHLPAILAVAMLVVIGLVYMRRAPGAWRWPPSSPCGGSNIARTQALGQCRDSFVCADVPCRHPVIEQQTLRHG